jgi:hypothetical protein
MPDPKTLRVLASGSAMVTDFEAQENPYGFTKRFIGRTHDAQAGEEILDPATKQKVRQGGFRATIGEVVELPNRFEYRQALKHGDLWAADEATAAAAGVAFDRTYGGEHDAEGLKPVQSANPSDI